MATFADPLMLEFLRRSSTSLFAWLILGLLALAFGLSFGLPSDSLTFGPTSLVEVHGKKILEHDYGFEQNLVYQTMNPPDDPRFAQLMGLKEEILEGAVEREVLAEAAQDIGLAATQYDVEDLVAAGHVIVMGYTFDWLGNLAFDYQIFKDGFLRNLQVSEKDYFEAQRKELLARTLRDLVTSSVPISEAELRKRYEEDANKLSLRYARYPFVDFAERYDPTPEEVQSWIEEHREELEKTFESQSSRFTQLPPQKRVFVIAVDKDGEQARERLLAAAEEIESGTDFRKVARRVSSHDTASRGGDYGWVNVGESSGLAPAVDEALASLEPGALSEPIEGDEKLWLVRVSGKREGDVPVEEALPELAEEAIRSDKAKELAQQAAQADLEKIEGGSALAEVFDTPGALGEGGGIEDVDRQETGADYEAQLRETGPFSKEKPVPGLGPQPEMVQAAWEAGAGAELLPQVFETADAFVVAGVVSKDEANDDSYVEARERLYDEAMQQKGALVTARWAKQRCLQAKGRGDISSNEDKLARILTYDVKDQKEPLEVQPYSVCDRVGNRGGLLRTGLMGRGG